MRGEFSSTARGIKDSPKISEKGKTGMKGFKQPPVRQGRADTYAALEALSRFNNTA